MVLEVSERREDISAAASDRLVDWCRLDFTTWKAVVYRAPSRAHGENVARGTGITGVCNTGTAQEAEIQLRAIGVPDDLPAGGTAIGLRVRWGYWGGQRQRRRGKERRRRRKMTLALTQ